MARASIAARSVSPACTAAANGLERTRQLHGLGAFLLAQVAVARRQRQAVVGAHGLGRHDIDRQRELVDHAPHDHQLLVVLLAEHGDTRLRAAEQLHHHGADAAKEARAEFAFQDVAKVMGRIHAIFLWLRIHVGFRGGEQHVDALALQLLDVVLQRAWIFVEVLVGAELQPVHEDRRHHGVTMLARQAHQRKVAFVQVAHRRHEGGALAGGEAGAQFFDGGGDVHGWVSPCGRRRPGILE
jgi:hypothetical protein